MNKRRARLLKAGEEAKGPVIYWMSRDQRLGDNWALLFAMQAARERKAPFWILFCMVPQFLSAGQRQYVFMLCGLQEMAGRCDATGIPFHVLAGDPVEKIPEFVSKHRAAVLVTDFDPLRIKREWRQGVSQRITIPFYEVDAHNIVPCWLASPKQEFSARTFRMKYGRIQDDFLDQFPKLSLFDSQRENAVTNIDWIGLRDLIQADSGISIVRSVASGEAAALACLRRFVKNKLPYYDRDRNNPTRDGQSGLSVYLHFGQISAQRVALDIRNATAPPVAKEAFLEELIIRRELSDNFCFYNPDYDTTKAFPDWAQTTLNLHRRDVRTWRYTRSQFETAETHDALWNAAQMEMVKTGRMNGYMRMYWAKKILEWSESPEAALQIAIMLNDKYEIDGRDPSGYAGCAWAIGGLHDRPWQERPIFGKIRYMNEKGCRRKFNVDAYVEKIRNL